MEVHKVLSTGYQEYIYQNALAIELKNNNLSFEKEFEIKVMYKGDYVGLRKVDFLVERVICVELKAKVVLDDIHLAQALNYLEASNLEIGLLINFGAKTLQYNRLINKKHSNYIKG